MTPLFDGHCHLQDRRLDCVRDEVIARAVRAGVAGCRTCGTSPDDWDAVAALASRPDFEIRRAFGVHPWYAEGLPADWLARLRGLLLRFPEAWVGEIGLDGIRLPALTAAAEPPAGRPAPAAPSRGASPPSRSTPSAEARSSSAPGSTSAPTSRLAGVWSEARGSGASRRRFRPIGFASRPMRPTCCRPAANPRCRARISTSPRISRSSRGRWRLRPPHSACRAYSGMRSSV